jgi:hypothetical protein
MQNESDLKIKNQKEIDQYIEIKKEKELLIGKLER